MPIHINNILGKSQEEEQKIFVELFKYIQNGLDSFSGNQKGVSDNVVMVAYNIKDKFSEENVLRCIFTIKNSDKGSEVVDVDVVINNDETTELEFQHLLDGSIANEYYYVGGDDGRTEIETVNRHLISGELTNTTQNVSLSAFPFKVLFANSIEDLNKVIGFKPTKYQWQEACGMGSDPITLGFAPDFISTSDLFKDNRDEHFGVFIGKIISHRKVCLEINDISLDCIIANVETKFGDIPTLISLDYEDSIKTNGYIFAEADIKADFSVDDLNYYEEIYIYTDNNDLISDIFNKYKIPDNYISFGLHCFKDNPNTLVHILEKAFNEGEHYKNYYGSDYINMWLKSSGCKAIVGKELPGNDLQFILDTVVEDGKVKICGFDINTIGDCEVELTVVEEIIEPKRSRTRKRIVAQADNNNNNYLMVNVVNSDILPSFLNGDKLKLQLIGIAKDFNYFESEEEYLKYCNDHNRMKLNMGEVVSINRNDSIAYIKGEVLFPYINEILYDKDSTFTAYAHVWIKTNLGDLDIAHSFTQGFISDETAKKMQRGAIFAGVVYLQGDALMNEYENGIVLDYKNNIRALRYAMTTGESNRLVSILNDDVVFTSESTKTQISGKENVAKYFDDIAKKRKNLLISNIVEKTIESEKIECIEIPFTDTPNQLIYIRLDEERKIDTIKAFDDN